MSDKQHDARVKIRDKDRILHELQQLLGSENVLHDEWDVMLYEYDGALDRARPDFVVFPRTTEEVSAVLRLAHREGIPVMPRGAGTGLSGGAIALQGGIVVSTSRMKQILEVDLNNRLAVVQPGVVNLNITRAVETEGFHFVPDPSSQKACTIGGNVAENSGGPHCLAYGVTANHVLGAEVVLPDGEVMWFGERTFDAPGYDLLGVVTGSEGTLAFVTKVVVRLFPKPERVITLLASFAAVEDASNAVSAIIADGTIPAALEMMDNLTIQAVEETRSCGYPRDAGAVLLIDLEGFTDGLDELAGHVQQLCQEQGATMVKEAADGAERERLWAGRKGALGAMGRISPSYYVQDGVIPRTKLPWVLAQIDEISQEFGLRIANVFHAGDGNLHPLILFDERDPEQVERVVRCGSAVLQVCVDAGGSITGEHGVGLEKREDMPRLFTAEDLLAMRKLKDAFNPDGLLNPGKIFPTSKACYEVGKRHRTLPAAVVADHTL